MTMASTITAQKKKPKNQSQEAQFSANINSCSKSKDLRSALSLYDTALAEKTRLNQQTFNTLLYLCSTSLADPLLKDLAIQYGYDIFKRMESEGIKPNEASITAVIRLASAKGDGDYAFKLVKEISVYNAMPRLRTCSPVLSCFCAKLEPDKAYKVEEHMGIMGIHLEEPELAWLLKVSAETGREERVYRYLQKLRETVRCVRGETARIIEDWFLRFEESGLDLDVETVREAILRNGGGWHGLGWMGEGKWVVRKGSVEEYGKCSCCGEQLVCVDLGDAETERFAGSLADLAMKREHKANFEEFQKWLDKHADYEAIVDGANIGLYQQNFAEGGFSIPQLDAVVRGLYDQGKTRVLIILHTKRVKALLENSTTRPLIEKWMEEGVLYTTPHGSNDDWYWLYAAVKLRCLLVTNDEMRDHIFELLGRNFFLKWKERHQIRYTFVKGSLELQMPSPFSMVIQESREGSWHVPVATNDNGDSAHSWLCITRQKACEPLGDAISTRTSEDGHRARCDDTLLRPSENGHYSIRDNASLRSCTMGNENDEHKNFDNQASAGLGKRKRS